MQVSISLYRNSYGNVFSKNAIHVSLIGFFEKAAYRESYTLAMIFSKITC